MAPNPRVAKAFAAMRELGLSQGRVKPVLKHLLKLYNKNWDLIEADNFHTLVEAIYELEDDEKKKEDRAANVSESSVKKPHVRLMEDQEPVDEENEPNMTDNVDELTDFVVPIATVQSGPLRVSSSANTSNNVNEDDNDDGLATSCSTYYGKKINFTFSPAGEVKISLNRNPVPRQPLFHAPDMKSILNSVENKFLSSNASSRSQLSALNLVKGLCESYLDHGNGAVENYADYDCQRHKYWTIEERNFHGSSSELVLVSGSQQPIVCDHKMPIRKVNDITKGTENVKIPLVDDIGNEILPDFTYIPQNTIYQNAYVHVSLARIADDDCCSGCSQNCLLSSVPCACARDTGGEYAYTAQGLLKEEFLRYYISMNLEPQKHYLFYCQDCPLERARNAYRPEPCKGHLVRKFIKECWRKCSCSMLCGNRVVQRGITYNLQVFLTKEAKGWGLQTLEDLPKGAFICEYVGEILTNMELYERNKQNDGNKRHTYPVYLDADWGSERVLKDEDALCLDATYYGNVARFINHRCHDANLLAIPVEVESPDHHFYHIAFFTKEKVNALEELTWDYGLDFNDHSHPIDAFECYCASAYCRGMRKEAMAGNGGRNAKGKGKEKARRELY